MTYREAVRYLDSFVNYEKKDRYDYAGSFNLDRIKEIAGLLGNPQDNIKSVHIAGTKGKGSTCAIIHSIMKEAGFKTGLYTSPHLISFRERIRIDDSIIEEEDIARILGRIKEVLEGRKGDWPSFFEVYTALAYLYFREKEADFAVYETGLGGRLDATNIIKPLAVAITPISYEHTDKLGSTLKEIAAEKGGIIKEGVICVSAPQEEDALRVIKNICKERKSKLIIVGKDIKFKINHADYEKQSFDVTGIFGEYPSLVTGLVGDHQAVNAATAIGVIEGLRFSGITVPYEAIRKGLLACDWPGRLEIAGRNPFIVLDGAQNRASAHALAGAIRKLFSYKKLILVLGVSKDKDIKGILEELLAISDSVVITKSRMIARACDPQAIKELAGSGKNISMTANVEESITRARELASGEDLILVTGSLFVVGEAKEILAGVNKETAGV